VCRRLGRTTVVPCHLTRRGDPMAHVHSESPDPRDQRDPLQSAAGDGSPRSEPSTSISPPPERSVPKINSWPRSLPNRPRSSWPMPIGHGRRGAGHPHRRGTALPPVIAPPQRVLMERKHLDEPTPASFRRFSQLSTPALRERAEDVVASAQDSPGGQVRTGSPAPRSPPRSRAGFERSGRIGGPLQRGVVSRPACLVPTAPGLTTRHTARSARRSAPRPIATLWARSLTCGSTRSPHHDQRGRRRVLGAPDRHHDYLPGH
jgi:hypothetical protein